MRTLYRLVPLLLVLALSACASSQPMARSSSPTASPDRPNLMHDDAEYIARVNAEARRRGLLVHWINPPPKSTAVSRVD